MAQHALLAAYSIPLSAWRPMVGEPTTRPAPPAVKLDAAGQRPNCTEDLEALLADIQTKRAESGLSVTERVKLSAEARLLLTGIARLELDASESAERVQELVRADLAEVVDSMTAIGRRHPAAAKEWAAVLRRAQEAHR